MSGVHLTLHVTQFKLINDTSLLYLIILIDMLVCILHLNFKSKIIIIHFITSKHYFNIALNISISKVCILLGASQQTRYVKTSIGEMTLSVGLKCYNTIAAGRFILPVMLVSLLRLILSVL